MTDAARHIGALVLAATAFAFVAVLVVLSVRMRDGQDPALRHRRPPLR